MLIKVKISEYLLRKSMVAYAGSIWNALFLFQIIITDIHIRRDVEVNRNKEIL